MNKQELIKHIAAKAGLSQRRSKKFLETMLDTLRQELGEGETIRIKGFGRWQTKSVPSKTYFNIATRRKEKTAARRKVFFRSSPSLNIQLRHQAQTSLLIEYGGYLRQALSPLKREGNSVRILSPQTVTSELPRTSQPLGMRNARKGLNLGRRVTPTQTNEEDMLEYEGTTTYEQVDPIDTENYSYPALLIPFKDTPILKYRPRRYATEGVVEPILVEALRCLQEIEPEIEILRNISLPVFNRNYGYKPDIAIAWRRKNVYIDIEIDEPYDIVSRDPIHYIGCGDNIRNAYFLNNGWTVIRVAERQIVDECQKVIDFVKVSICQLTSDKRFRAELNHTMTKRWEYDEAKKWANEKYREAYLGIKEVFSTQERLEEEDLRDDPLEDFEFVKPAEDIIEDRFANIRDHIKEECRKGPYIVFSLKSKSYDYVAFSSDIFFGREDNMFGVKLHDVIEEKDVFLQFPTIESFHATDSIVKQVVNGNEEWSGLLWDAILDSNPIEIAYDTAGQGHPVTRTLLYLTPWYELYNDSDNRKKYSVDTLLEAGNGLKFSTLTTMKRIDYFTAFCVYRHDIRTFNTQRIKGGKIFDCHKNPHEVTVNDVWKVLESGHADMVERMYHALSKYHQSNLFHLGNYANALVMQGRQEEALSIYLSVPKERQMTNSTISWQEACAGDINSFIEEGKHKEEFEIVWSELRKHGW